MSLLNALLYGAIFFVLASKYEERQRRVKGATEP
jgi:hypothetical protein